MTLKNIMKHVDASEFRRKLHKRLKSENLNIEDYLYEVLYEKNLFGEFLTDLIMIEAVDMVLLDKLLKIYVHTEKDIEGEKLRKKV